MLGIEIPAATFVWKAKAHRPRFKLLVSMLAMLLLLAGAAEAQRPEGAPSPAFLKLIRAIADPTTRGIEQAYKIPDHIANDSWLAALPNFEQTEDADVLPLIKRLTDARQNLAANARGRQDIEDNETARMEAAAQTTTRVTTMNGRAQYRTEGGIGFGDVLTNLGTGLLLSSAKRAAEENATDAKNSLLFDCKNILPKVYPASPEKPGLITPRIRKDSMSFENTSGRTLRDVTIYVELVHFCSLPEPTIFRVLHADQLGAGDELYIYPRLERNYYTPAFHQGLHNRPVIARQHATDEDRWTLNNGGIIEARVTSWTRDAHEMETVIKFPDAPARSADYELRAMHRVLAHLPDEKADAAKASRLYLANAAGRVLSLAPNNLEITKQARDILANPDPIARQYHSRRLRDIQTLVTGRFTGEFKCDKDMPKSAEANERPFPSSFASDPKPLWERWKDVQNVNAQGSTSIELSYLPAPVNKVKAYLFDPANPQRRQAFIGDLPLVEFGLGWVTLKPYDEAAAAAKARAGARQPARDRSPAEILRGTGSKTGGSALGVSRLQPSGGLGGSGLSTRSLQGAEPAPRPPARRVTAPPVGLPGPDVVSFNDCATQLDLEIKGDRIEGTGWSGPFQFPLTLTRASTNAATPQARAVLRFPDLAKPESVLNKEFVRRYRNYQSTNKGFFSDPEWPTKLATECQAAVAAP